MLSSPKLYSKNPQIVQTPQTIQNNTRRSLFQTRQMPGCVQLVPGVPHPQRTMRQNNQKRKQQPKRENSDITQQVHENKPQNNASKNQLSFPFLLNFSEQLVVVHCPVH